MSLQKKKASPAPAHPVKAAAPAPQGDPTGEEIDQIMSEIEELQQEMAESTAPEPKKSLKVIAGGQSSPIQAPQAQAKVQVEEESILKEFQVGADSAASLESTLSELGDEPSTGHSLLDQMDTGSEPDLTAASEHTETEREPGWSREELEQQILAEAGVKDDDDEERQDHPVSENGDVTEEEILDEELSQPAVTPPQQRNNPTQASAHAQTHGRSHVQKEITMAPKNTNETEGTMSMTVSGNMTLKIKYEFDGQEVVVGFSDNFLHVELSDGTEFKIPVSRGSSPAGTGRKAA